MEPNGFSGAEVPAPCSCSHLFVYGTLRKGCANPNAELLAKGAEWLGPARMPGRIYRMSSESIPNYTGLTAPQQASEYVCGEVFAMRNPEATLTALDVYEGCAPGSEFFGFVRRIEEAELAGGERLRVWVYPYVWPVDERDRIHSGDFLCPES